VNRRLILAAGLGAALGSLLRALAGALLPGAAATGLVNLAGSFLIGFVAAISGPAGRLPLGPARRQLVMGGFCGGLTTFSAMALETLGMVFARDALAAGGYVALVVLASLAAARAGVALAERLNRREPA
jgi:fluoride exporter